MSDNQGCSDGYCRLRIGPPPAQHTNGGCRCLQDVPVPVRIAITRKLHHQQQEITRLKDVIAQLLTYRTDAEALLETMACECINECGNRVAKCERCRLLGRDEDEEVHNCVPNNHDTEATRLAEGLDAVNKANQWLRGELVKAHNNVIEYGDHQDRCRCARPDGTTLECACGWIDAYEMAKQRIKQTVPQRVAEDALAGESEVGDERE